MNSKFRNPNTPKLWDKLLFVWNDSLISSPYYLDKLNKVFNFIKVYSGNFLDIGIGVGNLEKELVKKGIKLNLHGIDISPKAIKQIKREIKGSFYVSEIFKMPFKNNFFNVVIILDVLEHIYKKDNKRALKEVNRVLKKDGGLVISVPLNENLSELNKQNKNLNKHVREYTFDILEKELNENCFEVKSKEFIIAFKTHFYVKSLIAKLLPGFRKPNLLIVYAIKK